MYSMKSNPLWNGAENVHSDPEKKNLNQLLEKVQ